jgi:serine protease
MKTTTWATVTAALLTVTLTSVPSASSGLAAAGASTDTTIGALTDQVLVTTTGGAPDDAALARATDTNLRTVRNLQGNTYVMSLGGKRSHGQIERLEAQARAAGLVTMVEPDAMMYPTLVPNDPSWGSQWDLQEVSSSNYGSNLPAAWDITTGTPSTVVAVIDTGVRPHADLAGNLLSGYDFIANTAVANDGNGRDSDASDPGDWVTSAESNQTLGTFWRCPVGNSSWHGTHVSGTIAAVGNNGVGVAGIAWSAKVLPVRVLGKCGGYTSDIVDGMRWAAGLSVSGVPANPTPAKVLNLSLGGSGSCTSTYQTAIDQIVAAGASVVVAAGNSNADAANFSPASCNGVITVAATGHTGNRAYYSNFGASVEIAAPGGDAQLGKTILSTLNAGLTTPGADSYANYQGTSMATPHVAGVLALMLSTQPGLTVAQRLSILQTSATAFPLGGTCATTNCGTGILNAAAAVAAASGTTPPPPPPAPVAPSAFAKSSPANGATGVSRQPTLSWAASTGASSYEYCLAQGSSCSSYTSVGSATSVKIGNNLRVGRTYTWQVRARNTAGVTPADAGVSFTFKVG